MNLSSWVAQKLDLNSAEVQKNLLRIATHVEPESAKINQLEIRRMKELLSISMLIFAMEHCFMDVLSVPIYIYAGEIFVCPLFGLFEGYSFVHFLAFSKVISLSTVLSKSQFSSSQKQIESY